MGEVRLVIDDREVRAEEGMTVLQAARAAGIDIPSLCYHEKLKPCTVCRICMVEVETRGRTRLDTACSRPVEESLVVRTRSERINRIRKTLVELMLSHAPDAPTLQALAREYGADRDRFARDPSFCIQCGLCVRYCAEVKGKCAVGFIDSGLGREIGFVPEIARKECGACKECFPLCPTSYLQARFVLAASLAFPGAG